MRRTENQKRAEAPQKFHLIPMMDQTLYLNLRGLAWFELCYKFVTFFLFLPLLGTIETQIMSASRTKYMTGLNVGMVLRNPLTWLLLTAIVLLMELFTCIELMGIYRAMHASYCGVKLRAGQILDEGIHCSLNIFKRGNWTFFIYSLFVMPMTNLYTGATVTNSLTIPDYIIDGAMERQILTFIYYLGMALLFYFAIYWIFSIPAITTQELSFPKAHRQSAMLQRKKLFPTAGMVILLVAGTAVVCAALTLSVRSVLLGLAYWIDRESLVPFLTTRSASLVFGIISIILFVLALPSVNASFIYSLYRIRCAKKEIEVPAFVPNASFLELRIGKAVTLIAILVLGFFFVPQRYAQVKGILLGNTGGVMIMAHRGDSGTAPENTIPAFAAAIANGADAAELDVQMTGDGVIVVMHDSSLKRTTGVSKYIWEVTYDEIRDLDCGSFFSKDFAGTTIPTLDETLKFCKGKLFLNIEIKRNGHDEGIVEKVLEIIAANGYESECDITSMDYRTLEEVKALNPNIYTVYTTALAAGDLAGMEAADCFSIEATFVNSGLCHYLRKNGKGIYVWTVNQANTVIRMLDLNVDAIITNNTEHVYNTIHANYGKLGNFSRITRLILNL